MGKIPPFRSTITTSLVPKPALVPKSDPFPPNKPHLGSRKKTTQSSKTQSPQKPTHLPAVRPQKAIFDSPSLSDAKAVFDSLLASPKSPRLERDFYNSVLQSYSSLSTLQDSFSFLNHMVKTSPSFAPDHSTFHIILTKACSLPDSGDCEVSLEEVHKVLNFMVNNNVIPGKATADVIVR
ncbi:hypothetical protein MLD38_025667 [Melastoma candidum]|uniref:Uncharacterized protein n=1 Tax=Melastoma candidum TaxID=119954 RepID=A0ACB9NZJ9_9MYRT|nr:hypothetical protein MLD38_025667 [Melastoma candidum]